MDWNTSCVLTCSPSLRAAFTIPICARVMRSGMVFDRFATWCETSGARYARTTPITVRTTTKLARVPIQRRTPRRSSAETTGFSRKTNTRASARGGNAILIGYSRNRYAM